MGGCWMVVDRVVSTPAYYLAPNSQVPFWALLVSNQPMFFFFLAIVRVALPKSSLPGKSVSKQRYRVGVLARSSKGRQAQAALRDMNARPIPGLAEHYSQNYPSLVAIVGKDIAKLRGAPACRYCAWTFEVGMQDVSLGRYF